MKEKLTKIYAKGLSHSTAIVILLLAIYYVINRQLLDAHRAKEITNNQVYACLFVTIAVFYAMYVLRIQLGVSAPSTADIPAGIKDKQTYTLVGFILIIGLTMIFAVRYDKGISQIYPLMRMYYPSQVCCIWVAAPIWEELIFRYQLYDTILKPKYGRLLGAFGSGILFLLIHFPTSLHSVVLYVIPTVLFYLIYENFGLYGVIVIHCIYNVIAI